VPKLNNVGPIPLGVYDHPSPEPGVKSTQLPDDGVVRFFRGATKFAKDVTNFIEGDWSFLKF